MTEGKNAWSKQEGTIFMPGKKVLIRAGKPPYESYSPVRFFLKKPYGNNAGNMVYAYGVFRMFMTDPSLPPDADGYRAEKGLFSDRDIDRINEEYSAYIIPLADAFRPTFCSQMDNLASFVRKLKIPAVVIGAGVSAPLDAGISYMDPCTSHVQNFVGAILEKSPMLGLRGGFTASYLSSCGFAAERDFTVIGCPSVYCRGNRLTFTGPKLPLEKDTRLVITDNVFSSSSAHRFLNRVMEEYPDFVFIPQRDPEIEAAYFGIPMKKEFLRAKDYPSEYTSLPYRKHAVQLMFSLPAWWNAVSGAGLCVGPRLHGSIMCMLEGVPAFVLPRDMRTLEVCRHHRFAHLPQDRLMESTTLEELLESTDFDQAVRIHEDNFRHYVDFLKTCGIPFGMDSNPRPEHLPLDDLMPDRKGEKLTLPYTSLGPAGKLTRNAEHAWVSVRRKLR